MPLDTERLSNIDRYGDRIRIIPAEVRGFYRKHRTWTQALLLIFFLVLPWTKINGQQSLLIDIIHRKFAIFGSTFFSHDAPLIFFLLATMAIGLAFVTSVWGRVWCGWACPQTVFIDFVFRGIERLVQGNYRQRRELDAAPMSLQKVWKNFVTWILFFIASAVIAHSFAAYFIGSETLLEMMNGSPSENWNYFVGILIATLLVLFNFGWFREQFCIIMCPYGRIQSVLLDENSKSIVYDVDRGEPRKGLNKSLPPGDCVSCNRCVQVCPTGIDIRKGQQLECIACTACADACDEIMVKVKKPVGLISYRTFDGEKTNFLKPRTLVYIALLIICVSGLTYALRTRDSVQIFVMRAQDTPFTISQSTSGEKLITNHFKIQIQNQTDLVQSYDLLAPETWQERRFVLTVAQAQVRLRPGQMYTWHFFVQFPAEILNAQGTFTTNFTLRNLPDGKLEPLLSTPEIILLGPRNGT